MARGGKPAVPGGPPPERAEVIRDGGDWFVSHCGWGQGGVYLAPLSWSEAQTQEV